MKATILALFLFVSAGANASDYDPAYDPAVPPRFGFSDSRRHITLRIHLPSKISGTILVKQSAQKNKTIRVSGNIVSRKLPDPYTIEYKVRLKFKGGTINATLSDYLVPFASSPSSFYVYYSFFGTTSDFRLLNFRSKHFSFSITLDIIL